MSRRVFYSFHYIPDNWRVAQIRNIGILDGNNPTTDNDWETIKKTGDNAIKSWINSQLRNRSCTVVLIGENTANRKWINYEIIESFNNNMGIVGIYIHKLKDHNGDTAQKGYNPFDFINFRTKKLSSIIKCYDPPTFDSKDTYLWIKNNIEQIIEESIDIRNSLR